MRNVILFLFVIWGVFAIAGDNRIIIHLKDGKKDTYYLDNIDSIFFDKECHSGSIDGHYYVDLGLPSGTLWATCNVGASKEDDYGSYFAYGETSPKETYTKENYSFLDWKFKEMLDKGIIEDSEEYKLDYRLTYKYDVASVNWGDKWCMPTLEQFNELFECELKCEVYNGRNGLVITGPNGNTLFLPTSKSDKCFGYYRTSTFKTLEYSSILMFSDVSKETIMNFDLHKGYSIRPVVKK